MWLQTTLNQFEPIQEARAADEERAYIDRQRWLRTCLTRLGPIGDTLTATKALAGRPYEAGWAGMIDSVTEAWEEVHAALDKAEPNTAPSSTVPGVAQAALATLSAPFLRSALRECEIAHY
jgi:hypothetical protein